jgi:hypothetical protein
MSRRSVVTAASVTAAIGSIVLASCSGTAQSEAATPFVRALSGLQRDAIVVAPEYRGRAVPSLGGELAAAALPASRTQYLFSTDYARDRVDRWKILNQPDGSSPSKWYKALSSPEGLAAANGALWIANTGASDILSVDAAGKLAGTLNDPHEFPVNLTAAPNKTLYVANVFTTSFKAGDVVYYTNYGTASSKPSGTLRNSSFFQVIGIAADSAGDVFVSNNTQEFAGGEVVEFPGGSGTGTVLTNVAVSVAGGLAIDPKTQDLLVVDQSASNGAISVYAPPYTGGAIATYDHSQFIDITLDAKGRNLYCADSDGYVDVYGYPSGSFEGAYARVDEPIGVAVQPPPAP